MKKIISAQEAIEISNQLKIQGQKIVLIGGFFDILHIGHIKFIEKAKEKGDFLFILLESDKTARKLKGKNRPINSQENRAEVLASLQSVDYIVTLSEMKNDTDYDKIVSLINPAIIAVTENDKNIQHKQRQAKSIKAKVLTVVSEISNESTTKLARIIEKENNL